MDVLQSTRNDERLGILTAARFTYAVIQIITLLLFFYFVHTEIVKRVV